MGVQRLFGSGAWSLGDDLIADGREAVVLFLQAYHEGERQLVFTALHGATCTVTTNGHRTHIMQIEADGSSGHAIDDGALGSSGGFGLDDGQVDEYDDRDTLPWELGISTLRAIIDGAPLPATWQSDR